MISFGAGFWCNGGTRRLSLQAGNRRWAGMFVMLGMMLRCYLMGGGFCLAGLACFGLSRSCGLDLRAGGLSGRINRCGVLLDSFFDNPFCRACFCGFFVGLFLGAGIASLLLSKQPPRLLQDAIGLVQTDVDQVDQFVYGR